MKKYIKPLSSQDRREASTAPTKSIMERADKLKEKLASDLEALAEKRLVEWRLALHARFPRLHGHISFGMGSEYVGIGKDPKKTKQVDYDRKGLMLQDAMEDVWEITDGYKLACPEDFTF